MRHRIGFVTILAFSCVAADWPRFHGPEGTGVAVGKPPSTWTEKEGVRWKTELPGPGSSSPVISGDRVYVTCYSGYGIEAANPGSPEKLTRHIVCLERITGKILWTDAVPGVAGEDPYRGYITEHGYASSTPAVDADGVYVFFGKSGVLAYDNQGKRLWQTSVGTQSDIRQWGSSASPILYKDFVIVNASSESRSVIALEKKTGKQAWKAEGAKLSLSFSTPVLAQTADGRTDLLVALPGELWGLNPDTGKLRWTVTTKLTGNVCPGVVAGKGTAFITGGFGSKGTAAIKVGGSGDVTKSNIVWSIPTSSYVPTPVLSPGRLDVVTEDGMAIRLKSDTGAVIYQERLDVAGTGGKGSRPFYASPVLADGKLFAVSRRSGVFVLKANDTFDQMGRNPPLDPSDFNASPAIVGDQLFLRSNKFVYCIRAK